MKINSSRRNFLRKIGLMASAALLSGAAARARVVIVGGGFAGAVLAKKLAAHAAVYLVCPDKVFTTCPMSNAVIGGILPIEFIRHEYRPHPGITHIFGVADHFDASRKLLFLKDGSTIRWDKLILAPGISLAKNPDDLPHGWRGGDQTVALKKRLEAMEDGGVAAIITPPTPYRCPPAPYERASLMAWRLRRMGKKRAKVMVLDSNHGYTKQELFEEGWKTLGLPIERVPLAADERNSTYRIEGNTITTAAGDSFKAELINPIPEQKAADIAMPLADNFGWCRVDPMTFESERAADVHVVGDAINPGAMPKSAFAANSQAKACAEAIKAWLADKPPPVPIFTNACYSLLTPDYGISITASYRVSAGPKRRKGRIVAVSGAGGASRLSAPLSERKAEAKYSFDWYRAAVAETF